MKGFIFPILVAALVPIRSHIVSRCFTKQDLKYLDPIEETDEETQRESLNIVE